jgi:hypothetical protein
MKAPIEAVTSTEALSRIAKAIRSRIHIIRLFCADFHKKGVHTWSVITVKSKLENMAKIVKAINGFIALPALRLS